MKKTLLAALIGLTVSPPAFAWSQGEGQGNANVAMAAHINALPAALAGARPGGLQTQIANLHSGSMFLAMPVLLAGFSTPPSTSGTTYTGSAGVTVTGSVISAALNYGHVWTVGQVIDGTADEIQFRIQGHSTQTTTPFLLEKSDGTDVLTMGNTGVITLKVAGVGVTNDAGSLTLTGAQASPVLGGVQLASGSGVSTFGFGYLAADGNVKMMLSWAADSATTEAYRMAVNAALTQGWHTTWGDAAGTTFVRKAGVMWNGTISTIGGIAGGVASVQSGTTTATSASYLVPVTVAGGNVTANLPAASAAKGQKVIYKQTAGHATNTCTVTRAGSDTITTWTGTGQTTYAFGAAVILSSATFYSDGVSTWYLAP